jgi:hypothetical protein
LTSSYQLYLSQLNYDQCFISSKGMNSQFPRPLKALVITISVSMQRYANDQQTIVKVRGIGV